MVHLYNRTSRWQASSIGRSGGNSLYFLVTEVDLGGGEATPSTEGALEVQSRGDSRFGVRQPPPPSDMGLGDGWGFRPPPPCSSSLGSPPPSDPRGEVSSPAVLCPGPKMGLLYPQVHLSSAAPSCTPATLSLFTLGSSLPFLSPAVSPPPPAVSPFSSPPPPVSPPLPPLP